MSYIEKAYRNEWKYILTNQEMSLLKDNLSRVMELDSHSLSNGTYSVHSLYFDDYKNTTIEYTDAGISNRYKWRIRYYGSNLNYLVLEKKEKSNGKSYKKSCTITLDEYNDIISGNAFDLGLKSSKKLLKELAIDMLFYDFVPKVIVDYERIAFEEPITKIRITFDTKISASYELDSFLDGDYQSFYLFPRGENLLEVKFEDIVPSYIRKLIEKYSHNQISFSKNFYGRRIIDYYMR